MFNLQASAERHLTEYDHFIASLKPRFMQRGARPVLLTSCLIRGICWCLVQTACSGTYWTNMGSPTHGGRNKLLGQHCRGIDRLAAYKDVDVLCFDHGNDKDGCADVSRHYGRRCRLSVADVFNDIACRLVLRRNAIGHAFCPYSG